MIHIELPLSKSQVNRALIAVAAKGNLLPWLSEHPEIAAQGCRDTRLMAEALQKHKAGFQSVDFQDAGTPCRLFTAYAAAQFTQPITISGNNSLQSRAISPLVDALITMGARITYLNNVGYPPITIQKGIDQWQDVAISTSVSSQFASALMLIAPLFSGSKKITLTQNTHSQSYVDLTLNLLQSMGVDVEEEYIDDTRAITLCGSFDQIPLPSADQLELEADWSSAAFFYPLLLGLADTNSIVLEGLQLHSHQGDVQLAVLGNLLGIQTSEHPNGVLLYRTDTLSSLQDHNSEETMFVDLKDNPDLVPALVVGWCILGKSVVIKGIDNLRYKECDRIAALQQNLAGLDCSLERWDDDSSDLWHLDASNRSFPVSLHIDTKEDHRIAMAFSALQPWIEALTFSDSHCVEKSFPNYWGQWKKCTFD
jgi:3-phosphoshikimate 1-carboxyvinyltransferase